MSGIATRAPVGSLVVERGVPPGRHTMRMIVGYRPHTGRCMTSFIEGSPWMTLEERLRIYEDDVELVLDYPSVLLQAEDLVHALLVQPGT